MATGSRFALGPVTVDVAGTDRVSRSVRAMFADAARALDTAADVTLRVAAADEGHNVRRAMTNQRFPYRFDTATGDDGARWRVRTRGGRPLITVDFAGWPATGSTWSAHATLHVPPLLARLAPIATLPATITDHRVDDVLVTMLTDVLEPLLWLRLLDHDAMLLHAGAIRAPSGRGVLLIGASHAGKTATVLELTVNRHWGFLGDDLVIVGAAGLTRLPKTVHLRSHHPRLVQGLPDTIYRRRSRQRVHRQIAPTKLMPAEQIVARAPASTVVRLVTAPGDRPEVAPLAREVAVQQAVAGMFDEYWMFVRGMNSLTAIDERAATLGTLWDRTCAALDASLPAGEIYEVRVPRNTPAAAIAPVIAELAG